uniref:hypothetical protein n=1 Tax=Vibrio vulnificus TaxID=672 RepID=UPI000CAEC0F1
NDYIGKTLKPWPILVDHYISDKTFGTEKKILSETLKTAPRRFYHWDEITELANLIVKEVKLNLNLKGQA